MEKTLKTVRKFLNSVLPLAPQHFIRSLNQLHRLNKTYTFRFKWKNRKIDNDYITIKLRTEDIDEKRGGVLVVLEAASQLHGKKHIASYIDNQISYCNGGGTIHFKGSKRMIIILDETNGQERHHFRTFGCHLSKGYFN